MSYESHHLSLEEVWFCREHPFDKRVIDVRRKVAALDELEAAAEKARTELAAALDVMNGKRTMPPVEPVAAEKPVMKRVRVQHNG